MSGLSNPNSCWAGVHSWARPVCWLRIATARLPGTSSWAKNVTDAAATRTRIAETILTRIRRAVRALGRAAGRREATGTVASATWLIVASLGEVGVLEDRLALALLEPDVVQVLRDRDRHGLVIEANRRGLVLDDGLGLPVVLVGRRSRGCGVALLDERRQLVVVVEGRVAVVRVGLRARPPDDPQDRGTRAGPVPRLRVVGVRRGVGAGERLRLGLGDQLYVEADLLPLLLQCLKQRRALARDDRARGVGEPHVEFLAVLRAVARGVPSRPAGLVEQLIRLGRVIRVCPGDRRVVARGRPADRRVALVRDHAVEGGLYVGLAVGAVRKRLAQPCIGKDSRTRVQVDRDRLAGRDVLRHLKVGLGIAPVDRRDVVDDVGLAGDQ